MTITYDMTGRTVFVFGGTSGINLGIAQGFADVGAQLGVASRSPAKVEAATAQLSKPGRTAAGYALDVRRPEAVAAAIEAFVASHGPIDVLISGAAGNFPAPAATLSPNGFKSVVDIDLLGTFNVMRAAYAHLRRPNSGPMGDGKPGASVINISAPQAMIAMAYQVHVCAAKAGVDMLTKTLALEWGPVGIRVNSVVPGPVDGTEGIARLAPTPQARAAIEKSVPLQRMGTPDDIAQVCLFLASDAARYVSGAILPVDGGWLAAGARFN